MNTTRETIARRVSAETLADVRTVRREMNERGSVRGLVGQRIREALAATDPNREPPEAA